MAEIRTVTTLTRKRHQIESAIENYKQRLDQARADLSHVNAVIALFEVNDDSEGIRPYTDIHRLYRRGEMIALCKEALAQGPMTTRELAIHIMKHTGLRNAGGFSSDLLARILLILEGRDVRTRHVPRR